MANLKIVNLKIMDLKCCGNCIYRTAMNQGGSSCEVCDQNKETFHSYEYCKYWEYDGLKRKYRKKVGANSKIIL